MPAITAQTFGMDIEKAANLLLWVAAPQTDQARPNVVLYVMAMICVKNDTMHVDEGYTEISRIAAIHTCTFKKASRRLLDMNLLERLPRRGKNNNAVFVLAPGRLFDVNVRDTTGHCPGGACPPRATPPTRHSRRVNARRSASGGRDSTTHDDGTMETVEAMNLLMWAGAPQTHYSSANLILFVLIVMCMKRGTRWVQISHPEMTRFSGLGQVAIWQATGYLRERNLVEIAYGYNGTRRYLVTPGPGFGS